MSNNVWDELDAAWKANTLSRVHYAIADATMRGRALERLAKAVTPSEVSHARQMLEILDGTNAKTT